MSSAKRGRSAAVGLVGLVGLAGLFQAGCGVGKGIRNLGSHEQQYFDKLKEALAASQGPLDGLLENTVHQEVLAIRELTSFDGRMGNAKRIYAIREVIASPDESSAEFIQLTRNKVILYYLAEAAAAENERYASALAVGAEERKHLARLYLDLMDQTAKVVDSGSQLHAYLHQPPPGYIVDLLAETRRQMGALNAQVSQGSSHNPTIQALTARGKQAEERLTKVDEALGKFIELWPQIDQAKGR